MIDCEYELEWEEKSKHIYKVYNNCEKMNKYSQIGIPFQINKKRKKSFFKSITVQLQNNMQLL